MILMSHENITICAIAPEGEQEKLEIRKRILECDIERKKVLQEKIRNSKGNRR